MKKIWLCILLDAIGCSSYLLPVTGEWTDVVWAPIAACVFYKLVGGRYGQVGALFTFLEEILPFTDAIPSFTLFYLYDKQRMHARQEAPRPPKKKHKHVHWHFKHHGL